MAQRHKAGAFVVQAEHLDMDYPKVTVCRTRCLHGSLRSVDQRTCQSRGRIVDHGLYCLRFARFIISLFPADRKEFQHRGTSLKLGIHAFRFLLMVCIFGGMEGHGPMSAVEVKRVIVCDDQSKVPECKQSMCYLSSRVCVCDVSTMKRQKGHCGQS